MEVAEKLWLSSIMMVLMIMMMDEVANWMLPPEGLTAAQSHHKLRPKHAISLYHTQASMIMYITVEL